MATKFPVALKLQALKVESCDLPYKHRFFFILSTFTAHNSGEILLPKLIEKPPTSMQAIEEKICEFNIMFGEFSALMAISIL